MYRIRPLSAIGTDSSAVTRACLLQAAAPLFAKNGYEATRTRDIADKAGGTNVSAINYHFGNKMGLYQAVITERVEQKTATYLLGIDAINSHDPQLRFRNLVLNLVKMALGDPLLRRIIAWELADPTEALDVLIKEVFQRSLAVCKEVIADVAERPLSDAEMRQILLGVLSQCYFYELANPIVTRMGIDVPENENSLNNVADHIARFSLAGIREISAW